MMLFFQLILSLIVFGILIYCAISFRELEIIFALLGIRSSRVEYILINLGILISFTLFIITLLEFLNHG